MNRFFCFFVFLSICIRAHAEEFLTKEQELVQIEKNILALEEEKNRYVKKVAKHRERGRDWQFNKDNSLESRREYFLADQEGDKIQLIELKIRNLNISKTELLEE